MQNEYLTNPRGHLVPIGAIKPQELLENDLVNGIHEKTNALNADLKAFKEGVFADIDAFLDILAEKYQTSKGGKKGNITLTNFEGTLRVLVNVQDFINFGAELNIAQDLINECIRKWLDAGNNAEITEIVKQAFRVERGRVAVQRILELRNLNIQDETWLRAMDAINDAIRKDRSKTYVRFQMRENADAVWQTIPLDLAKI